MKNVLIIIAIMVFLSGCIGTQKAMMSQEMEKDDTQMVMPGFKEGTDCFNDSRAQEFPITKVCVPDKESAIRITGVIMENFQKDGLYLDYVPLWVNYDTDDEIWIVLYAEELLPGCGVSVAIRKSNAEIVAIWSGE